MKKSRRIISLVLALILMLSVIGCSRADEPLRIANESLRIVVDVLQTEIFDINAALEDLGWYLEHTTDLEKGDYIFECIPAGGAARETAISRLRTEIMSGGGPDVFIVQCSRWEQELFFPLPEKAMELGFFLPLDEYIAAAEYAEWDKFTEVVMDAGKNEEGQQMVPLTYSLPVAMYRKEDVSHTPTNMTWDELQESEELQDAAIRLGSGHTSTAGVRDFQIAYVLGDLADYKNEEILFTEEELLRRVDESIRYTAYFEENNMYETPFSTKTGMGVRFNWDLEASLQDINMNGCVMNGLKKTDELTLVPYYSDDGGNAAIITSFAAVNRNTQHPEEAFMVIDLLMMTNRMQNGDIFFHHIYPQLESMGMPMHEELMSEEYIMKGSNVEQYGSYLDDKNFEAFCAVRDQITSVNFSGSVIHELMWMMEECYRAYENGEEYSQVVHEAYDSIRQMIAE